MDLYRYMPFEYFVDMVLNKELTFVDPLSCWPDKYEGYVYSLLKTEEGEALIENFIQDHGLDNGVDIKKHARYIRGHKMSSVRLMSWCADYDSVVMWNAYSYNTKAIMIKTKQEKINKIKYKINETEVYVFLVPVQYINELSLRTALEEALKTKGTISHITVFEIKRDIYSYENEYRAIAGSFDDNKLLRLSYAEIDDFIEDVMVHPDAEEGFIEIVRRFCDKNGLPFSGKSKLHEFATDKIKIE